MGVCCGDAIQCSYRSGKLRSTFLGTGRRLTEKETAAASTRLSPEEREARARQRALAEETLRTARLTRVAEPANFVADEVMTHIQPLSTTG
jgi:hypothetical protein